MLGASAERSLAVIPNMRTWSPAPRASLKPVDRSCVSPESNPAKA